MVSEFRSHWPCATAKQSLVDNLFLCLYAIHISDNRFSKSFELRFEAFKIYHMFTCTFQNFQYIYIYIYIYLLIYYLPTFTVTEKKKRKQSEFRDNKSRITAWGKKKKIIGEKEKERPTSSHQLKKIKRYAISWSKEQKPTAKRCNATITKSAQYQIEPITKIKSWVGTILQQFRLKRLLRVASTDSRYRC